MSAEPGTPNRGTLGHWLGAATGRLADAGVESARLDARLIAAEALGWDPARVIARPEHPLSAAETAALDPLLARRRAREPMAMIAGRREFWGMDFRVTGDTLVPRPDSETVIEAALAAVDDHEAPMAVLDLGTGSGCLLLALLSELPRAAGLGVDVSDRALSVAAANADDLGLSDRTRFRHMDWADLDAAAGRRFDVIVANPPYIESAQLARLEPEVAVFEPRSALDGGADGLDAYRTIAPLIDALLAAGGRAFVEIGATQADAVGGLFLVAGLGTVRVHRDLAGRPRVVETQQATGK